MDELYQPITKEIAKQKKNILTSRITIAQKYVLCETFLKIRN